MALKTARHMDDDDKSRRVLTPYNASNAGELNQLLVRPLMTAHTPGNTCYN